MEKTWRWFGPKDKITLDMLREIGVEGIVTALHDVPNGQVWTKEQIMGLKNFISSFGLRWSVVESLPVSEEIKYAGPRRDTLIDNYIQSLDNLGECGVKTVCYNFMPVIDWVRTELEYPCLDGGTTLYFNYLDFAYFDLRILERRGSERDYPSEILQKVSQMEMSQSRRDRLIDTIIVKTQGFINGNVAGEGQSPLEYFRSLLSLYDGVSKEDLRDNLKYFLKAIMPVCRKWGINMCIHPDDPPMKVFGLPRIAGNIEDLKWILSSVMDFHNGITFCAGSLSAGAHNNVVSMARQLAPRTHFVHIRTCDLLPGGDFVEAKHTEGRVPLVELVRIFEKEGRNLPMRVDHGRTILGDEDKGYNPGYSFHGRMLALGQVDGMMAAVRNEIKNNLI